MSFLDFFRDLFRGNEVVEQTVRAVPAAGGTVYSLMTLNEWVALATGIYIALQVAYLARKWYREEKDWRGRKRGNKQ